MEGGTGGQEFFFFQIAWMLLNNAIRLQKRKLRNKQYFSWKKKTLMTLIPVIFVQEGNRRGVGFDKVGRQNAPPVGVCFSMTSFAYWIYNRYGRSETEIRSISSYPTGHFLEIQQINYQEKYSRRYSRNNI
jgi:hypothetical protein